MAEVTSGEIRLHVEVDGEGAPVTAIAHGLTNSCRELAMLTALIDGTKVRFDFRGHGHSGAPEDPDAFTFADMAADLEAVAAEYGATRAIGTSMGAGAICNVLCERPDRFERVVLLLPAGIDRHFTNLGRFQRYADALETLPKDEAIERILDDPDRIAVYLESPWLRDIDRTSWEDLADPPALARAIRGILRDVPVSDRELLRGIETPVFLIAREGDPIHPAEVARTLVDLFPNAELEVLGDEAEMFAALPMLVQRVREFLGST
jgi:pimeloyl-ACP methyl ester carboxylesterase